MKRKAPLSSHHPQQQPVSAEGYSPTEKAYSSCCSLLPMNGLGLGVRKTPSPPLLANDGTSSSLHSQGSSSDGDRLLVEDLNNLSIHERQQVYEEIHGVNEDVLETEAMVNNCLEKFQGELDRLLRKNKGSALRKAIFLAPSRVKNKDFRLQFLRCDDYDPARAAKRMIDFFDFCLQYFGMNALMRDVTIDDLSDDDLEFVKNGPMQILLNTTDRSGRPVMIFFNSLCKARTPESMARGAFFVCMQALRNPIAQRRGAVMISWNTEQKSKYLPPVTPQFLRVCSDYYGAVVLKMTALHFCYDDPSILPILELVKLTSGRQIRVRFRSHFGSAMECKYALMTFGIDCSRLPLTEDGDMDPTNLNLWLIGLQREAAERAAANNGSIGVIYPQEKDVLLGRGKPYREFPGNVRLGNLVEHYWDEYSRLNRNQKLPFAKDLTTALMRDGTRFLRRAGPDQPWESISLDEAVEKVSHTFRNKPVLERYRTMQHHQQHSSSDDEFPSLFQKTNFASI